MKQPTSDMVAYALGGTLITITSVLLIALIFGVGVGILSLFVWLGNYGLHVAFGLPMLGFTKTIAVGAVVAAVRMLFSSTKVKQ